MDLSIVKWSSTTKASKAKSGKTRLETATAVTTRTRVDPEEEEEGMASENEWNKRPSLVKSIRDRTSVSYQGGY